MMSNSSTPRPASAKPAKPPHAAKLTKQDKPAARRTGKTSITHKPAAAIKPKRTGRFIVARNLNGIEIAVTGQLKALSTPSQQAVLKTVARVGDSIVQHVDSDREVEHLAIVQAATRDVTELLFKTLKTDDQLRKRVDPQRVESIGLAAKAVIGRLIQDAYSTEITDAQLSDRAQLAIDTFDVVLSGDIPQLEPVIVALGPGDASERKADDENGEIERARARARIRMQAIFRKILSESLTISELKPYKSRQRLQQLRDADRLFAIKTPYERGLVYPSWQFDDTYDPLAVMPALIHTAKEVGLSPLGFHQIMTGRRVGGKTGVELLGEGHENLALSLIRASDRDPAATRG
jgi:hypothetical protein